MRDIETRLRESLAEGAEAYDPGDVAAAERTFLQKRGRRRLLRGGAAVAFAGAAVVAVFALVQPEVVTDREQGPQPAGLQPVQRFDVADEPLAVAGDLNAIWVASRRGGVISRIDPSTDEVMEVELEGASQVADAGDAVWAAGSDRVVEIDPRTGEFGVMVIDWPRDVIDMAAAGDEEAQVWVVTSSGCVADVTNLDDARICVGPEGFHATDITTSPRETWILDGATGDLNQLDPEAGVNDGRGVVDGDAPIATAPTGPYADLLLTTAGNDALWASGEGGRLMRLDLVTGDKMITRLDGDYADLAEGYGGLWALVGHEGSDRGDLVALDVGTGAVVGEPLPMSGKPSDLVATVDGVWVTLRASNEVVRIVDPDQAPR